MAHSTELREQTLPTTDQPAGVEVVAGIWSKIKLVCLRSIFWTYKRGSWQYDIIVVVILAFIFLTPRSWYVPKDPTQITSIVKNRGVLLIGREGGYWRYIVDARLVRARGGEKLEDAVREILTDSLKQQITVVSVDELQDKNKAVYCYSVKIEL